MELLIPYHRTTENIVFKNNVYTGCFPVIHTLIVYTFVVLWVDLADDISRCRWVDFLLKSMPHVSGNFNRTTVVESGLYDFEVSRSFRGWMFYSYCILLILVYAIYLHSILCVFYI